MRYATLPPKPPTVAEVTFYKMLDGKDARFTVTSPESRLRLAALIAEYTAKGWQVENVDSL